MPIQSPPDVSSAKDARTLYSRCCSTDPNVCGDAFQELGRFLLRIAYARLKGRQHHAHLAEDCAQQALAIIWRKLQEGRGPERVEWFSTWCASIVIHRIQDELRKTTRARVDSLDELTAEDESQLPQQSDSDAVTTDFFFVTAEDRDQFISLIENHPRLSAEAKLVLLHGYLLEQDDQTLADQLGKSRATVRVLRFRALHLLRSDKEFMAQVMSLTHAEPMRADVLARQ